MLAPIIGLLCVGAGWHSAGDKSARWQLIWTQALHWVAFIVVMNVLLLPTVQRNFSANATGLAIFTLLALVPLPPRSHSVVASLPSRTAYGAGIPAIAWIENTALFFVLVAAGALALVAVFGGMAPRA